MHVPKLEPFKQKAMFTSLGLTPFWISFQFVNVKSSDSIIFKFLFVGVEERHSLQSGFPFFSYQNVVFDRQVMELIEVAKAFFQT